MRRCLGSVVVVAAIAIALAGCGSSGGQSASAAHAACQALDSARADADVNKLNTAAEQAATAAGASAKYSGLSTAAAHARDAVQRVDPAMLSEADVQAMVSACDDPHLSELSSAVQAVKARAQAAAQAAGQAAEQQAVQQRQQAIASAANALAQVTPHVRGELRSTRLVQASALQYPFGAQTTYLCATLHFQSLVAPGGLTAYLGGAVETFRLNVDTDDITPAVTTPFSTTALPNLRPGGEGDGEVCFDMQGRHGTYQLSFGQPPYGLIGEGGPWPVSA